MPVFTPPTQPQAIGKGLWSYIGGEVGQSVVKIDGTYVEHSFPAWEELEELTEGTDYFLGGRTYWITEDTATALENDGFTTEPAPGYGVGTYGSGGYGD